MTMSTTIARQMIGAEFLKLRKKRGTVAWALVLAAGSVAVLLTFNAIQHASNPTSHDPAGGTVGFKDMLQMMGFFMAPLAAILIGTEAGAGDRANGVFRDLVVTGRSRLALFFARVPGALMLTMLVIGAGFLIALGGTYLFAAGTPTPNAALVAKAGAWVALANGVTCMVAVGLASLIGSRPATITSLIGWQLVASPVLLQTSSLGSARQALLDGAFSQIKPGPRGGEPVIGMTIAAVVVAIVLWLVITAALGAWRTATQDA
jgi:ABC-type transport system involved in multi-copper enzyme maturation permease subunit